MQHDQIVMTDSEFQNRAEALLKSVELACDRLNEETDVDLDAQRSGNMITLVFANRSQIVVNLQKPLHEVWLATKFGGYHFRWSDNDWRDTKTGQCFFTVLNQDASNQAALVLAFD